MTFASMDIFPFCMFKNETPVTIGEGDAHMLKTVGSSLETLTRSKGVKVVKMMKWLTVIFGACAKPLVILSGDGFFCIHPSPNLIKAS